ncbi:MAG: YdcF family protein [Ruminococcus sp.]|nr:YdcF family protein [Ruminococcus sp.]
MTVKYIILAVEIFMLITFLAAFPVLCAGNIAGIASSIFLIIITQYHEKFLRMLGTLWKKNYGKVTIIAICIALTVGIVYAVILSSKMYRAEKNKPDKTELIVVLGCQVRGERPSRMLRRRLDTAYKAIQEHPEALCVVSGGKGADEKISEAECMKRYLLDKGVDEDRIVMEDRSTSTFENIKFTFEITDKLGYGRDITIVTDGFHQYRAGLIAKSQGADDVTAYSAQTEARFLPTYWVREWMGLSKFFLTGH